MKHTRLLSLLLALLMCVPAFASCGSTEEADTTVDTSAADTEAVETEEPDPFAGTDFGGAELRISSSIDEYDSTNAHKLIAGSGELNGEIVNDAVYQRNADVEELLNVNLNFIPSEWTWENGHTEIGVLGGYIEHSKISYTRYMGCLESFEQHNVAFDKEKQYMETFFNMADSYSAMQVLMQKMPDITAVFAMSDVMAIGAIRAINDSGKKVPEDISVVGFDGLELAEYLYPKLTTIRQNRERIAQRSVEILLDCIDNGAAAVHETVPFSIIVGESTRKL